MSILRRAAAVEDALLDAALLDAICEWMAEPLPGYPMAWALGNAQGIARAIAIQRGTTFTQAWEAGLNAYQNQMCTGKPYLAEPNPPGAWRQQ
jgi:predicted RNA polymerase sigma factor